MRFASRKFVSVRFSEDGRLIQADGLGTRDIERLLSECAKRRRARTAEPGPSDDDDAASGTRRSE